MESILDFWEKEATANPESTGYQLFFRNLELTAVADGLKESERNEHIVQNVLDLGCGNGHVLKFVQNKNPGKNYYGIDFSPAMIEYAKRLNILGFFTVADFRHLPFKDGTMDYIYSIRALINLQSPQEQIEALQELKRVLAPNGDIVLVELSQKGFDNMNMFLTHNNMKPIEHRWHNCFFNDEVEQAMKKIFFTEIEYYPVTSLIKYSLESKFGGQKERKSYQSKYNGISNMIGGLSGFIDRFYKSNIFGGHVKYKLCVLD